MEQGDWSELPMDLLGSIVRRLYRLPDDYVRFGAVCESWRLVALQNKCNIPLNQLPGLMVPGIYEDSATRHYLRLNHKSGLFEEDGEASSNKQNQLLQVPNGNVCRGSGYGWLFLINDELDTRLFNPFSGAEISLPSVAALPQPMSAFNPIDKWYVNKAVYSSNPSIHDHEKSPPVILIIYLGDMPRLAYCKLGDSVWTPLQNNHPKNYYMDAIYYKDQFFALDVDGRIMAYDIGATATSSSHSNIDHHCEVKVTQYACIPGIKSVQDMFLVELHGELVVLTRKIKDDDDDDDSDGDDDDDDDDDGSDDDDDEKAYSCARLRTVGFTVLRLESSENKWVEMTSLGDTALFVGYSTSYSLPAASNYPGCVPNSIYFTNGSGGYVCELEAYNIGIYDLTDNSIKPVRCPFGSQIRNPFPIWLARFPC